MSRASTLAKAVGANGDIATSGNTTIGDAVGDAVTINGTATFVNANPTLTAGTANGVAYLNGSKVVTSGSALQFDGTNLGVGVTPSAWSASYKALQVSGVGIMASTSYAQFGVNTYYDGSDKYIANGYATYYSQSSGAHKWFSAPNNVSGAGASATATQAMTLDASGNLVVGATSAISSGKISLSANLATYNGIVVKDTTTSYAGTNMFYYGINSSGASVGGLTHPAVQDLGVWGYSNVILSTGSSGTERARVDSSGNFFLGTTSATNATYNPKMQVNGTILSGYGSDATNGVTAIATTYAFGGLSTFGTLYGGKTAIGFACQPLYGGGGFASSVSYPYARSALMLDTGVSSGAFTFYGAATTTTAIGSSVSLTSYLSGELNRTVALQGASTVAGTGITFPTTPNSASNGKTLDDYEEGTWGPIMVGSSSNPTVTYTKQAGKYTKVGNLVHVQIDLRWSALSGGSGSAFITLPFTSSNDQYSGGVVAEKNSGWALSANYTYMTWENNVGTAYLIILQSGNGVATGGFSYGVGVPTGTGYIIGSFTFTV